MKNINRIILICSLIFGSIACNDDKLDEVPKDFFSPDNLYSNSSGFETATTALYEKVRRERRQAARFGTMTTGTDLYRGGLTHPANRALTTYGASLNSTFTPSKNWWDFSYEGIAWANLIIERTENPDVDWANESDKNLYLAEGRFFRAYYHNLLQGLFNDVPLVTEFSTEPKLDYTRTPRVQVLEQVRDDLIFAAANLPSDPGSTEIGKLTRYVALHLLAEVYLALEDFTSAANAAQEVIDGPHQLMTERFGPEAADPKGNVFHDLFLEGNVAYQHGNLETIWTIRNVYQGIGGHSVSLGGEGWANGDWSRRLLVPFYQRVTGLLLADSLGGRGIGRIGPTEGYLNLYEDGDMRNDNINLRRDWYYNNPDALPAGKALGDLIELDPADPLYQQRVDIDLFPAITKFDFGAQGRGSSATYLPMDKDRAQYRLAETYLLLAEAQHRAGNNGAAATTINVIRVRSNAAPIAAGDVTMDFILDERARELYGETYRRLVLARTDKFFERTQAMNPQVSAVVAERDRYLPIPQSVIDGNPDAEFPQNPGY